MRTLLLLILFTTGIGIRAKSPQDTLSVQATDTLKPLPFKGHFYCKETGVNMYLDLYEESLTAPGFEFLGPMHGYMKDSIYGTWMITKCSYKGNKATLRFSNDIGSDSQDIEFTLQKDGTYSYHAINGNVIKKAVGTRLVKFAADMVFTRKEK